MGLDIPARRALIAHVRRLVREEAVSVLWATHLAEEVEPSDRLIVLNKRKVVMNEIAAEATTLKESVEAAFTALIAEPTP
jgi:ABC-2 type transport system ATP-binding protein